MMYDSLLARSFSKHEQRKLGYGAMVASFFIALSIFTVFKPYLDPLQALNLQLSNSTDRKLQIANDTSSFLQVTKETEIITNNSTLPRETKSPQELVQISETMMNHIQMVNHTTNTLETKMVTETKVKIPFPANDAITFQQKVKGKADVKKDNVAPPVCNIMERSDFCEIKGDIRIDGNSGTVYIVSSKMNILAAANTSWSVRPYARKRDATAMSKVRDWSVKLVADHGEIPKCTQNHNVPSILFSLGGYSGNHFHAFTDIIVPLYATARPFNGDVQFLITDRAPWWVVKFGTLLKALSRYDSIDIDKKEDIHCFPSITVGLKGRSNKELSLDPASSAYSIKDFRTFLRSSYSLKRNSAIKINDKEKKKPRLLIIPRKRSRAFTNLGEISKLAKNLGFRVVTAEPNADVSAFARIINSCDVVLGVHGAGLTNIVFLPENAILIQIAPFGGADWVWKASFEEPAKDMNIRYLKYKIQVEESTLTQQYPRDHVVFRDPIVIGKQGWEAFKAIYLDKQNVKLDINRFRPTLVKALELLHQ